MEYKDVLENLCSYDRRSPYSEMFDEDDFESHEQSLEKHLCSCDNCFYGRTKLANELLKYIKPEHETTPKP